MANGKVSVGAVLGIVLGGLLLVVGAVALYVMSAYNGLVRMDVNVKTAWSQVENQLQRRNDLIPNLVNTVKGFAAQEKSIFTEVAEARAKLAGATSREEQIQAANGVSGALGRLLAVVENYPQLKSDANFRQLMDELAGTENRIAVERKRFNDTVAEFNKAIRVFPRALIAGAFGFKAASLFEVAEGAAEAPKVEF